MLDPMNGFHLSFLYSTEPFVKHWRKESPTLDHKPSIFGNPQQRVQKRITFASIQAPSSGESSKTVTNLSPHLTLNRIPILIFSPALL